MRTPYFDVCMQIRDTHHCEENHSELEKLYAEKARLTPLNHCTKPRSMNGWAARENLLKGK